MAAGREPLFQSHMWDGSAVELEENLKIARELLEECAKAKIVMELEIGVVGGEEDGVANEINEKLYTTPEDALRTVEVLGAPARTAATCWPRRSATCTASTSRATSSCGRRSSRTSRTRSAPSSGEDKPFDLVFHGGSGSDLLEEIRETLDYGVVKMNVDTDTQYAFTRPVVGHMFTNYDGVLKVDGEVGNKKLYDPRAWGKAAEAGMAARVVEACEDLRSAGTTPGTS